MKRNGFTLMEVLAVLLVLAVIASLAVPGVRSVRYEIKNGQAKTAAKKMIEGIRQYRRISRGGGVQSFGAGGFTFSQNILTEDCTAPISTGIPGQSAGSTITVNQLFVCGFLSPKDFRGLPYTFYYGAIPADPAIPAEKVQGTVALKVLGTENSGPSYSDNTKYAIYVDDRLEPLEYEAE